MSEIQTIESSTTSSEASSRSLWPAATVILLVVFTPALLAWGMTMLRH